MQIIDESPAEFPTVTICDSNPFTTQSATFLLSQIMQEITYNVLNTPYSLSLIQSPSPFGGMGFANYYLAPDTPILPAYDVYQFATSYTLDPSFSETDRRALGWDFSQFVTKCTFNGFDCNISRDFEWYFDVNYGNCYRFNAVPTDNNVNKFYSI